MRLYLLVFFFMISFFHCDQAQKLEDDGITGAWKLTEVLADPGDGSGIFRKVESDKEITFYEDGIVKSNGQLSRMYDEGVNSAEGMYSLKDSTITSGDCTLHFEIEGNILTIYYPCIEPCGEKYIKVQ